MMWRKTATMIILGSMLLVQALLLVLPASLYETYFVLIRPIAYIILLVLAFLSFGKDLKIYAGQRSLLMVVALGLMLYLAANFVFGLFTGFGANVMNLTPMGILRNFWAYIAVIILQEILRSFIMRRVQDKRKYWVLAGVALVFTFASLDSLRSVLGFDLHQQVDWFFVTLLPVAAINIWLTYSAMHGGLVSNLIFMITYNAMIYFVPVLPNITRILDAIITYCVVFVMFIVYDSIEWMAKRQDGINVAFKERRRWMWTVIPGVFLALCLAFGLGLFPLIPMAVASNSMAREFKRGALIYVVRTDPDDLQVGDIVQYTKGRISIVHRIIEIHEDTARGRYFIFQGDENALPDDWPVYDEQIVGKVAATTPWLGFPSLLFQDLRE
ncbi:signal peptidase I [Candidatus Saccharibacteria bacterium]|nr:signal peptidase I [Candidatus Saccharibacteria bacterium]